MNRATRISVTTMGVIFGLSGITHGFSETLQGNTPTNGLMINAIAADSSWTRWTAGGEGAFTIVPNFLATGVLAMLVGLTIIVWSLASIHKPRGPLVYLLLFVLLFLVGGGIGQVIFFIPAWAVATRIHKPLTWWRQLLPVGLRKPLAQAWPWLLGAASLVIVAALAIAIWGYIPGVQDMDRVLNITLSMVGISWIFFLLAFVAGFARDLETADSEKLTQNLIQEDGMSTTILVAYATRSGSTQEVAEAVAATLREDGLDVEVQPLREVQSLADYGAVVLGAPLYMFHWHKDAKRFLARHRQALTALPTAIFALGPFEDKPEDWAGVRAQLDKELAKFPWLAPVAIEIVGGKFDPATLRFPFNLIPGLKRLPASDIRDWPAIRAWANGLAEQFQPALLSEETW